MRAVVQRVRQARVFVRDKVQAQIGSGLVVLIGVGQDDNEADATYLADKIARLRIFDDSEGKLNLSVTDINGEVLVVSQFTLLGEAHKGRRPSYAKAASAAKAAQLYQQVIARFKTHQLRVSEGKFQEYMLVEIANDGPVTILLDSKRTF